MIKGRRFLQIAGQTAFHHGAMHRRMERDGRRNGHHIEFLAMRLQHLLIVRIDGYSPRGEFPALPRFLKGVGSGVAGAYHPAFALLLQRMSATMMLSREP